jgi:hypothetical protein
MAYYTFTEINSYTEGSTPQKDYKVEIFSDSEKTILTDINTITVCGSEINDPAAAMRVIDESVLTPSVLDYAAQRKQAYPTIEEQLDMQYHDSVNGTTTWKDFIASVKSSIPKE